jgi:hypothetical protein
VFLFSIPLPKTNHATTASRMMTATAHPAADPPPPPVFVGPGV